MENPIKKDITQNIVEARAHLEQALANIEQLPAWDPGMLSTAAHALNNCLSVIYGSIDLFLLTNCNRIDDEVNKTFEVIHRVCNTMSQIITDLRSQVAFSRESGIIIQSVDIITVLKRASYHYNEKAKAKEIRIFEQYPNESLYIQTDWLAFAVIIDNILSNAIKYSPRGKAVYITVVEEGSSVKVSIRDEGPGISASDQVRMYQRGARLTAQPTAGELSTGYGLAIAKEVSNMIGASLLCQSELGQGAEFIVAIPTAFETKLTTN